MAWRIHDHVVRGEIDNRTKGVVRGRIWLHGTQVPLVLELKGNAHPDLAGCLLTFENPAISYPLRPDAQLYPEQRGTAGDLTASRKVRIFDVPLEEAMAMIRGGEKPPEHWANSLYLEWFSERSGRVVLEAAEWPTRVSPPQWQFTPEDEAERQKNAEAGWNDFVQRLDAAVQAEHHEPPSELEDWDEFDWERSLRESDARAEKYRELLEKHCNDPDAEERIAREMGWYEDQDDGPGERLDGDGPTIEELNAAAAECLEPPPQPDPVTEGVDWVRGPDDTIRHPLELRCSEQAMWLVNECSQLGLDEANDPDVERLLGEFQTTSAKLAGALNGLAYGRKRRDGAFVVACLKRALQHLHATQAGLERVWTRDLLPAGIASQARDELFGIREEILRLMKEFRAPG
jgi:hypothetical protein